MRDIYLFVQRFISCPKSIGSLLPSSNKLGLCITDKVSTKEYCQPARYLEIGGGSGALTSHIVKSMHPLDQLDVVESDPKFCSILRDKFNHLPNVAVHEVSILNFEGGDYDALVSSLPLNAFKAQMVREILRKYKTLVKKEGSLSYFEYLGVEKIKQTFLSGEEASDFEDAILIKRQFALKYGEQIDHIWWNFPPARVIHCKM